VEGDRQGYRRRAEEQLRQGRSEAVWSSLKRGVVLGSERFAEKMRKQADVVRETRGCRVFREAVKWEEVVAAVEDVKQEKWDAFSDRYGDWGRDMAFWVARRRAGMTLTQLGEKAGGLDYSAVSEAIRRFEHKKLNREEVKKALCRVLEILNMET
jgi:hypothetical protein